MVFELIWEIANECHIYRHHLSGVSDGGKECSTTAVNGGERGPPLSTFCYFSLLFGISAPPLSSWLGYVNPQKSHGLGLLTLIKLLPQPASVMSLSKFSKMGAP